MSLQPTVNSFGVCYNWSFGELSSVANAPLVWLSRHNKISIIFSMEFSSIYVGYCAIASTHWGFICDVWRLCAMVISPQPTFVDVTKWLSYCRWHFQTHFVVWNLLHFGNKFIFTIWQTNVSNSLSFLWKLFYLQINSRWFQHKMATTFSRSHSVNYFFLYEYHSILSTFTLKTKVAVQRHFVNSCMKIAFLL